MSMSATVHTTDVMNRRSGGVVVVVGVVSIVAGLLAIVYPDLTLLALALITGINLLILGALGLVEAIISDDEGGARTLNAIVGLLGVIAGLVVMRRPGETLLAIILILGVWFVVSGLVQAIRAITTPQGRVLRLVVAVAEIAVGGLILSLPDLSLATIAVLTGVAFIIRGVFAVFAGLTLRKLAAGAPQVTRVY
jgi:uncharacterized membrane protein HdeD (DUF308 family)